MPGAAGMYQPVRDVPSSRDEVDDLDAVEPERSRISKCSARLEDMVALDEEEVSGSGKIGRDGDRQDQPEAPCLFRALLNAIRCGGSCPHGSPLTFEPTGTM